MTSSLRVVPGDARHDLSIPGLPARFVLEEKIGSGGQGKTFRAVELRSGENVVVKLFSLANATAWKAFDLFERECAVLRSLGHPAIPLYVDHGGDEATGTYYLVMQYAEGETLQAMLDRQRRFTDAELEALVDRLLTVLEYLHELNPPVIHRDVKPGNVIVRGDGHVWLVDFGSVRDAFADGRHSTVVGTYGYMAPEQLRGVASAGSDLYGLGATIAACACGVEASQLPVRGLQIALDGVLKPGRLRTFLDGLLQPDPRARPQRVVDARRLWTSAAPRPAVKPTTLPAVSTQVVTLPARRAGNATAILLSAALMTALLSWIFGSASLFGLVGLPLVFAVWVVFRASSKG